MWKLQKFQDFCKQIDDYYSKMIWYLRRNQNHHSSIQLKNNYIYNTF